MNIQHIAIKQSRASREANQTALTPEQLAAVFAKVSRSDDSIEEIIARIPQGNRDQTIGTILQAIEDFGVLNHSNRADEWEAITDLLVEQQGSIDDGDEDAGVKAIFDFIDFGHQSIADMPPVAIRLEGLSLHTIWYMWYLIGQGSGIEKSTRYCRFSEEGLVNPSDLGISAADQADWLDLMQQSFIAYERCMKIWEDILARDPSVLRVPTSLLSSTSRKDQKVVERLKRNYAFDRARYFIPVACHSSMGLVLNAREWMRVTKTLLSSLWPEAREAGQQILNQLWYVVPKLVRHGTLDEQYRREAIDTMQHARSQTEWDNRYNLEFQTVVGNNRFEANVDIFIPSTTNRTEVIRAFRNHKGRYSPIGKAAQKIGVSFIVADVSMAEIRDMNRHRPGTREIELSPQGFYVPYEEIPNKPEFADYQVELCDLARRVGLRSRAEAVKRLLADDPTYVYWTLLGQKYCFEQTTTLDKLAYILELRTGAGVHFRYAEHYRAVAKDLFSSFPELRECIPLGTQEPE